MSIDKTVFGFSTFELAAADDINCLMAGPGAGDQVWRGWRGQQVLGNIWGFSAYH
jgi:hypothetical protein